MKNMRSMMMPIVILLILVITSAVFAWRGIGMHSQVSVEEAKFHTLQQEYFIMSKVEREAALTGSELNQKLVHIQNYPSELLRLKLVGVGKILTGIYLSLIAIVFLLFMMPIRLAKLMKEADKNN
jgi:hypothetical protein